jgi:hypothetical protein
MKKNFKIRIKKDTPFDKAGTMMSISDFRLKYGYICTKAVTDQELVDYILQFQKDPAGTIDEWFEIVEIAEKPEPILEAIIDGIYYSKGFDGFYHMYPMNSENSIGVITPENFLQRMHSKKLWKTVTLAVNDYPF